MHNQDIDYEALLALALKAAEGSYAPYSRYCVGAAILADDGQVFTGANVENVYIGCTICAERTAAVKAVSAGVRRFLACAIACPTDEGCLPCGICRQFLSEFGLDQMIVVRKGRDGHFVTSLANLLPDPPLEQLPESVPMVLL
jgi:cytidine deaminase